jgi:hypothetical protein
MVGIVTCIVLISVYYVYSICLTGEQPISSQSGVNPSSRAHDSPGQLAKVDNTSRQAQPSSQRSESERTAAMREPPNTKTVSPNPGATKAGNAPKQPGFDVERRFVNASPDGAQQRLNAEVAQYSLKQDFKSTLQALQDQSFSDATVGELNDSYRSAITEQLSQIDPDAHLSDFACGIQVCFGQIDMGGDTTTWQEWQKKFYADSRTPSWVFMEYDILMPDGSIQHRFAITIDPALNAVDVAPQP